MIVPAAWPAESASAAPGDPAQLYLGPSYEVGTIGSDKDLTAPTECPSNSVLTGVRTENRQDVAPNGANGILTEFSIQCSTITTAANGAIVTTVNPTWQSGPGYDQGRGNIQTAVCPAGTVGTRMSGTTFVGQGVRWPSQVQLTCQPLVFQSTGELRVNLAGATTVLTAGTNFNTNGGLQTPTPLCGPGGTTGTSNILLRGYRAQSGGEGIDGYNPSCAVIPRDFGDAPASYGAASHELNAATYLGSSADGETAQQTSANASGDNVVGGTAPNNTTNDEDGVATFGAIIAGVTPTYSVQVAASNKTPSTPANLVGWIDFNRNGTFEVGEGASATIPAGTPDGSVTTLTWSGIDATTVAGASFARFRIGTAATTASTPTGTGGIGEVEDYPVTIQAAAPAVTVTKTATPSTITAAGTAVTYSFTVTNTGDAPLTGVTVNETAFSGTGTLNTVTCPTTSLAVGASTTCTATYTATQADVDAGSVTNTATATGTDPRGTVATSTPSTAVVTATPAPALTVTKSATPSDAASFTVGQVVDYSFLVANTGNVTLTNVTVTEGTFTGSGSLSAITCPNGAGSLSPGASVTCTASYTLTQADIDNGSVSNTATATGTPPNGGTPPTSPPSTVEIPALPAPALSIVKSADTDELTTAGQTVTYTFTATNTGNVTLEDVSVTEGDFSGTGVISAITPATVASLIPGETATFTATYVVTQADIDSGNLSNTATATGNPPGGGTPPVSPPSTVDIPVTPAPALTVAKTADMTEITAAGQTVTYTFVITNTGNVTASDVSPVESDFSGTGDLGPLTPTTVASLAPGDSATFTASYVVTQADVDSGALTNTATAAGETPGGDPVPTPPGSTVTVPVTPAPALTVEKTSDTTEITTAGQTITYSFEVTNTGNVTASDVAPTEGDFTGTGEFGQITPATVASLAPGDSATFTATYVVTQTDVDSGALTNTATATGTTPGGDPFPTPPGSTVTVPVTPGPALTVTKTSDTAEIAAAGQTVTYSFVATNTGNVTLADVSVSEGDFSGTGELGAITPATVASLAPGDSATFTATYVVTQADIDSGSLTNSATATGTPPGGGTPPVSPPSTVEIPVTPAPALTVVKTADTTEITAAGQTITYSFVVTNTGNVTASDVSPVEGGFSGTGTLSPVTPAAAASLAPGESATFTATYVVTQADVDSGALSNTATATGTTPGGDPVPTPPGSSVEIPVTPAPALTVVKTADTTEITEAGQTVTYSFVVTNTGNVTANDVSPVEGDFSGTGDLSAFTPGPASLAPGESETFTATYVVTQADLDSGALTNTASATGTTPGGDPFPPAPPSTVDTPTNATPGISVVKSADITQDEYAVGTEVTYSFVAANTGNVTLTDVTIDEGEFSGTGTLSPVVPEAVATLAPGETATFTATYVLTQADVDAGEVTNTATATGTPVFRNANEPNTPLTSTPSSAIVPVEEAPAVTVDKTADITTLTQAGQTVTYSFLVTNTGNTTITDPVIDDTEFSGTGELSPVTGPDGDVVLLPGEVVTYTATYVVTQADVDSGALTNTATVTGTTPGGDPTDPSTPSTVTVPTVPAPSLTIVKTADKASVAGVGQIITYTFTATNTGNVTQRDVAIVEGRFTGSGQLGPVACNAGTAALAPGAILVCTAQYQTTAADVRAGSVSNTAVVTGVPAVTTTPGERTVSDPSTARVTVTAPTVLAFTGTDGLLGLLGLGGGLVLLGALLIPAVRRRRIEG
jgi:uncharacterized repeat protein (TIGR01451 family)